MPRKTRSSAVSRGGTAAGFNEAAARCRGKPTASASRRAAWTPASMRPRPDAAENQRDDLPAGREAQPASMRPRPDAAENSRIGSRSTSIFLAVLQ